MGGSSHVPVKQNTEQSLKSRLDWMRKKRSSALFLREWTLEKNTQGREALRLRRRNLTSAPTLLPRLRIALCGDEALDKCSVFINK